MIEPILSTTDRRMLRHINPHLEAKWNRRFVRWEIWFDAHCGKMPYIIATAKEIDGRIFDELRHAFWWSQHILHNMIDMNEKANRIKEQKLKKEEELHYDMGKEIAPLLRSMKDAGTSSHGNSKFMFPGADFGGAE
jgi:hypothetical protein